MSKLYLNKNDNLSKFRIVSLYFATAFVLFALFGILSKGLNLGLDFTGGYLTEFSTQSSITQEKMTGLLSSYLPENFKLSSTENGTYWSVQQADNSAILEGNSWLTEFSQNSGLIITPQDAIYIGSQVGDELIDQGGLALLTSVLVILLYLSFRFEWRLAAGSVIALFHDVIIVLGIFAWFEIPFDLTIVASLLAIIGYSLNDSIIIGDKVREIMKRSSCHTSAKVAGNSTDKICEQSHIKINNKSNNNSIDSMINLAIKSTMVRTLITSGTTLATILAIWFFAGESLAGFSIALFSGILVGTFSSIAISATVPQLFGLSPDYYQEKEDELCSLP